jgi:hypothetical protein
LSPVSSATPTRPSHWAFTRTCSSGQTTLRRRGTRSKRPTRRVSGQVPKPPRRWKRRSSSGVGCRLRRA